MENPLPGARIFRVEQSVVGGTVSRGNVPEPVTNAHAAKLPARQEKRLLGVLTHSSTSALLSIASTFADQAGASLTSLTRSLARTQHLPTTLRQGYKLLYPQ